MYVGLKMLKDFRKITPKTSVKDADRYLRESDLWMLLVVDEDSGELVGYVRKEDIAMALPSVMTTLEKHEALYLLTKLTVGKVMRRDITVVPPEMEIEAAAEIMFQKKLAGLAVVDSRGKLVGYINRTVMLDVLVEEMGLRQGGSRIVFEVEDRTGVIFEVSGIIREFGVSIISTGTFFHDSRRMVVIRLATDDPSRIAVAIGQRGYRLVTAEDFVMEWLR
ncbi:CBS domain-containing protein [Desulfolutivibrio sulfoxidireducens]|uniref:CBS domain-containing protein n=1 Tax=Desulfolutivibrio sulfoxidireducens TaxID=2773299 RepID=UPI00159EACF1|nr:CBS domain-containing protein [Desulfolutivibrio sulfoxidireducens]QLA16643.1 CBS domain-containing protein [Desulfolutivibrio sulfoxidireducens]QLA19477.1 CBS domain-containing protein [Desulfolutivibrio sulfoxidireducens]